MDALTQFAAGKPCFISFPILGCFIFIMSAMLHRSNLNPSSEITLPQDFSSFEKKHHFSHWTWNLTFSQTLNNYSISLRFSTSQLAIRRKYSNHCSTFFTLSSNISLVTSWTLGENAVSEGAQKTMHCTVTFRQLNNDEQSFKSGEKM